MLFIYIIYLYRYSNILSLLLSLLLLSK